MNPHTNMSDPTSTTPPGHPPVSDAAPPPRASPKKRKSSAKSTKPKTKPVVYRPKPKVVGDDVFAVFSNAKALGNVVARLCDYATEVWFEFSAEGLLVRQLGADKNVMAVMDFKKSAFHRYTFTGDDGDDADEIRIGIESAAFQQFQSKFRADASMTLHHEFGTTSMTLTVTRPDPANARSIGSSFTVDFPLLQASHNVVVVPDDLAYYSTVHMSTGWFREHFDVGATQDKIKKSTSTWVRFDVTAANGMSMCVMSDRATVGTVLIELPLSTQCRRVHHTRDVTNAEYPMSYVAMAMKLHEFAKSVTISLGDTSRTDGPGPMRFRFGLEDVDASVDVYLSPR